MKGMPYKKMRGSDRVRLDITRRKHCFVIHARPEQLAQFFFKGHGFSVDIFLHCLDKYRRKEHLKYTRQKNYQLDNVRVTKRPNPDFVVKQKHLATDDELKAKLDQARQAALVERAERKARKLAEPALPTDVGWIGYPPPFKLR